LAQTCQKIKRGRPGVVPMAKEKKSPIGVEIIMCA